LTFYTFACILAPFMVLVIIWIPSELNYNSKSTQVSSDENNNEETQV
jgi:hypothetical protein